MQYILLESSSLKKIAVTGGIGVGKSSFCSILNQWGRPVISADEQAKKALSPNSPCYPDILKIFNNPPQLNAKIIAQKIFNNPKLKTQLEECMHPYILQKIIEETARFKEHNQVFYEIPLLFEKNLENHFHFVILVICPEGLQKKRLMKRSQLSELEAVQRIQSQMPQEEKLPKSDFIVENNKTLTELTRTAKQVLMLLKKRGVH